MARDIPELAEEPVQKESCEGGSSTSVLHHPTITHACHPCAHPSRVSKYTRPHTSQRAPNPLWDIVTQHPHISTLRGLFTMPAAKARQRSASRARGRTSRTSIDAPRAALSDATNISPAASHSRTPTRSFSAAASLPVVKDGESTQRLVVSEVHYGQRPVIIVSKLVRAKSDTSDSAQRPAISTPPLPSPDSPPPPLSSLFPHITPCHTLTSSHLCRSTWRPYHTA
jgi:hypothetical protein